MFIQLLLHILTEIQCENVLQDISQDLEKNSTSINFPNKASLLVLFSGTIYRPDSHKCYDYSKKPFVINSDGRYIFMNIFDS